MISSLVNRLLGRTLTCEQVSSFLIDYIDGRLEPRVRSRFEEHIAMCVLCRALLDQYRTTVELVKESGEPIPPPPPELADTTLDFLNRHLHLPDDPGPRA